MESDYDNWLSFLDVNVKRLNSYFVTSVFQNKTFYRIGISYFSNCCKKFKPSTITTLLNQIYNECSSYSSMHVEFCFLRILSLLMGFHLQL